ncbi:hypothetical protein FHU38_002808 [Saccharomonospora amisosensis]|uniref:Uncharacterized protein n=1 Tax=Saccharomonospora amisosensis TaxID=1128677 RepID=A0A7X5URM4_9PSEU|nr:hypothetical protein [Saccharomonospora amisosensis]NIJ12464.1 hypothetical protein [Saccharomonospora amisosensis]
MRKGHALGAAAACAALTVAATGTAIAADTTVTFVVSGADLIITAPLNASLGSAAIGGTVSGSIGVVTVSDQRGISPAPWTADVAATNFTTGTGGLGEVIPNGNVRYWSGPATATSGTGTFTPGQPTAAQQVPLNVVQTAFSHDDGAGANSASWDPTLVVSIPGDVVAGAYSGVLTHSVF